MQNQQFDISKAPVPPHRAERRFTSTQPSTHRDALGATPGGLIRSTIKAFVAAAAILVFLVLPAEFGVDPTGVGRLLGLTEMGEIKQQLASEAEADQANVLAASLGSIDNRLAAIEREIKRLGELGKKGEEAVLNSTETAQTLPSDPTVPANSPGSQIWRDTFSYTLLPSQGIEVKLVMSKGDRAEFEWDAGGAVLNHDTHGDGSGQSITYIQGRGVSGEKDVLTAAFSGNHGWFWRNRTDAPVTLTLRAKGEYERMLTP